MSRILNIETATDVCSVCISEDGKVTAIRESFEGRNHAVVLAEFIRELFEESRLSATDLDAVAVSMGPGSYTGLRIGVSTAKGICYGAGIPLIGINSLASMYQGFMDQLSASGNILPENALLLPMIDARRMEVYTAHFNPKGEVLKETHALIVEPHTFTELLNSHSLVLFGTGADKLTVLPADERIQRHQGFRLSAASLAELAAEKFKTEQFENLAYSEPFYLKDFITTTPKRKVF